MRRVIQALAVGAAVLLCNLAVQAADQERFVVAVYEIDTILEKGKEALPFNRILGRLSQEVPDTLDFRFYNPARAIKVFRESGTSCLFPSSKTRYDESVSVVESEAVQTATAHFFALKPITLKQVLDTARPRLRIGFRRGNTFGGNIALLTHHQLIALNTKAHIRELLERGRLDAYVDYLPDMYPVVTELPERPLNYSDVFYSQNDSIVCHDTLENRRLLKQIDRVLRQLKASAELDNLLYRKEQAGG